MRATPAYGTRRASVVKIDFNERARRSEKETLTSSEALSTDPRGVYPGVDRPQAHTTGATAKFQAASRSPFSGAIGRSLSSAKLDLRANPLGRKTWRRSTP
jgi:hypothetical protein